MRVFILASTNEIYKALYEKLSIQFSHDKWIYINDKNDLSLENLNKWNPSYIFFPHWSFIIPSKIYSKYECVVFHMTDLPYGRGGSPLQNLIVKGHTETKLSALRVSKGIDTGDIYLKEKLSLDGKASDIFLRASSLIGDIIKAIIDNSITPTPQQGEVVKLERRTPNQSDIKNLSNLSTVYDYIRMLDAPGYPKAFLETEYLKFEFTNADISNPDEIIANVRIIKK